MRRLDVLLARAFRLAIAFALTISVAVAAGFALIYFLVHREDAERNASILVYEARSNANASEDALRHALAARLTSNIRRVDYIALFDKEGNAILGNLSRLPPVAVDGKAHLVNSEDVHSVAASGQPALLVAEKRADGDVLVMGRDLTESYQLQSILLRVLAIALLPTVLITLGIGVLFAGRATRRLRSVQDAIARIIEGDLTVRLPISRERDDIDRVAQAVNVMLDEIARLLDQLKSVGDNIAHDLRAPLAVARAKVERALEAQEEGRETPAHQLAAAIAQLDRAAVTIDALLRIAAVESGMRNKRFEDIDLALVCDDVREFYEPVAQQKSIALSLGSTGAVWIRGDLDLMREAIANLVDNAIKFSPEGGEVRIACGAPDGTPFVEVSDTGPGVPETDRDKIFRRFYTADRDGAAAGHGIGLSIAQTIAQLHGFVLRLEASEQGARFVMRASEKASLARERARLG